jgi:phosphatidylserine/phosphatidylglycerophosphate/cardiolipin synthase-like enzyme
VKLVPNTHAKFLVVDSREASVFSANIDEKGLDTGAELGITVRDDETAGQILDFAHGMAWARL